MDWLPPTSRANSRHDCTFSVRDPMYKHCSMDVNLNIMFWNVRGLNSRAKRSAVRTVITSASPSIVCLQETKLSMVSSTLILETLGGSFDGFYFLPATATRGDIILAWQSCQISLSNPKIGDHHVSEVASSPSGG